MWKRRLISMFIFINLVGCSVKNNPTTIITETNSPTRVSNFEETLQVPTNEINRECIAIQNSVPETELMEGFLIINPQRYNFLEEGDIFRFNLKTMQKEFLIRFDEQTIINPNPYTISLNKKWYFFFKKDLSNNTQMYTGSVNGEVLLSKYWDNSWHTNAFWLNNSQIFIVPKERFESAFILNPFSGEWREINSEFPSGLNFSFPYFYYNSTLSHAIYNSGDNYILWDSESNNDLWTKQTFDVYKPPAWSPNGDLALMAVSNKYNNLQNLNDELFLVNSSGIESQLTNFTSVIERRQKVQIRNFVWSPNGKNIALSLTIQDNNNKSQESSLLLIDIDSQKITDLCIPIASSWIIWSPDGNKIVVNIPKDISLFINNNYQVEPDNTIAIMIDIENDMAFKITDTFIEGWME